MDVEPSRRTRYVAEAAAGDLELIRAVEALIEGHVADPEFMEVPLARVAGLEADSVEHSDGEQIGPFKVVRKLGAGGMGQVFLALQEGDGFSRHVALKLIRPGLDQTEILRRFELERRILAGLRHPNIAALIDGGATADGRPWFAMEFVEGQPIDQWCDERKLCVNARVALFRKVCDAVQHAHQNLILHRDLKPGNILVTDQGVPKLLDFGVARLVEPVAVGEAESAAPETRIDARMLTPEYAAPEQILGDPVSAATDVFGLGALLFELLTGRRPHESATGAPHATERAVLEDEVARPSTTALKGDPQKRTELAGKRGTSPQRLGHRLRGDLDTIVLRALSKEPERRYPSAAAFGDDLERFLKGMPVRARADTLSYRTGKFLRRRAVPVAAATVAFLALSGATLYSLDQSRRVAAERDKAIEVRSFLLEMFGASGADQSGDSLTARALLDRQGASLNTLYANQPELQAEMMTVVAEGYDRLGLLSEADSLVTQALALRRSALGQDSPQVAASLSLLGWIRHQRGESEEGRELIGQALQILEDGRASHRAELGVVSPKGGAAPFSVRHECCGFPLARNGFAKIPTPYQNLKRRGCGVAVTIQRIRIRDKLAQTREMGRRCPGRRGLARRPVRRLPDLLVQSESRGCRRCALGPCRSDLRFSGARPWTPCRRGPRRVRGVSRREP